MNNIIYIKKDPILTELDNSIDKQSAKKMIAFKYFNNNIDLLDNYLDKHKLETSKVNRKNRVKGSSQLEFSF